MSGLFTTPYYKLWNHQLVSNEALTRVLIATWKQKLKEADAILEAIADVSTQNNLLLNEYAIDHAHNIIDELKVTELYDATLEHFINLAIDRDKYKDSGNPNG
jgi:hypothetical protein